jgi:hypothetical protein
LIAFSWHDRPHGHVDAAEALQVACRGLGLGLIMPRV